MQEEFNPDKLLNEKYSDILKNFFEAAQIPKQFLVGANFGDLDIDWQEVRNYSIKELYEEVSGYCNSTNIKQFCSSNGPDNVKRVYPEITGERLFKLLLLHQQISSTKTFEQAIVELLRSLTERMNLHIYPRDKIQRIFNYKRRKRNANN